MNQKRRLQLVEEVLASHDPHGRGKQLAREHGLNFGRLWSWVLDEAHRRAQQRLPAHGLMDRLLDHSKRACLLADIAADRTLTLANRLSELLPGGDSTGEQIRSLIRALPVDCSQDGEFMCILWNPSVPEGLLFELLDEGRFISVLGHRGGPQKLLERLADEHTYPEAITTLVLDYYVREDYPLEKLRKFVQRHRHCIMLGREQRSAWRSSANERQRAVIESLDQSGLAVAQPP